MLPFVTPVTGRDGRGEERLPAPVYFARGATTTAGNACRRQHIPSDTLRRLPID